MKKYLLFSVFLMVTSIAFSQFTLTSSYNLEIGDTYRYDLYDEVLNIDPGPSGGGINWDFSTINGGTYIAGQPALCVNPAGTPFADSAAVANANLCTKNANTNDGAYVYYHFTNNIQELLGQGHYESGYTSFANYIDDLTAMEYPCSYGDVITDDYESLLYNSTAGGYFMRDSGSVYVQADAYGSLSTPAETYNNVLRVTTTTTSYTWMNFGGNWTFTGFSSIINYNWFAEGIKVPVMSITEFVGFQDYSLQYLVEYNFPVGIREQEKSAFKIFPNPCSDNINIEAELGISQLRVYAADGRLMEDQQATQSTHFSLDIAQWHTGIYIIELKLENGEYSRERFIKR